ncbi:hypothetical protein Pint_25699 [Pistacia integerrima]|uniref:Uncharacterized protein n=1 Tax=Pistacia integerrima TaxID=434235 RepID=A0ACC0YFP9_9ROSI|nr:hypothetical protein Pint_25699 [Pistacia integerrima]
MAEIKVFTIVLLVALVLSIGYNEVDAGKCCKEHALQGGCTNDKCNTFCKDECRGGECKHRNGKLGCHCYC